MPPKLHVEDDFHLSTVFIQDEDKDHAQTQDGGQGADDNDDGHLVLYAYEFCIRHFDDWLQGDMKVDFNPSRDK